MYVCVGSQNAWANEQQHSIFIGDMVRALDLYESEMKFDKRNAMPIRSQGSRSSCTLYLRVLRRNPIHGRRVCIFLVWICSVVIHVGTGAIIFTCLSVFFFLRINLNDVDAQDRTISFYNLWLCNVKRLLSKNFKILLEKNNIEIIISKKTEYQNF